MEPSRRTFLAGGTAAGALLLAGTALAAPLGGTTAHVSRASRAYTGAGSAIAYAAPFFLEPSLVPSR